MKKYFLFLAGSLLMTRVMAGVEKDYPASLFSIRSDGRTLNTRSIQFAIDYIAGGGGGRLVFSVGRYLTGSIHLKSGVSLELKEGAMLLGSLNPFDYDRDRVTALIFAEGQQDIAITGRGVIDGQGRELAAAVVNIIQKGLVKDLYRSDRPEVEARAMLIDFEHCRNMLVRGITLRNSASWVETYNQCRNIRLDSITVDSRAFWNNDGIDIMDCDSVAVTNSYVDAADDGICLKSADPSAVCQNVEIRNNTIRSSANAIKFGTTSYGGFRHIRIYNNRVFDTYRSALALEAVDGGFLEDVIVDSLVATHTGNAILLRLGDRVAGKKSRLENVEIRNVDVEIAADKPDAGYDFEGPVEDLPRNTSPVVMAGLQGSLIDHITLDRISIRYPGGGNPMVAKVGLDELDRVPELPAAYPEFSMFRELPAWGVYIRHVRDLRVSGLNLSAGKKDYRVAIVLDDVHKADLTGVEIRDPEKKKEIFQHDSSEIIIH